MPWYAWLLVGLGAYLVPGLATAIFVRRSSRPQGAKWAVVFWPLWYVRRSA